MLKGEQADRRQAQKSLLSFGRDEVESRPERVRDPRLPSGSVSPDRHPSMRERRDARRRARFEWMAETPHNPDAPAEATAGKGAWEAFADTHLGEEPFHIVRRMPDDQVAPRQKSKAERPPLRTPPAEAMPEPRVDAAAASPAAGEMEPVADAPVVHAVEDTTAVATIGAPAGRPERDGQLSTPARGIGALLDSKRLILATTILGAVAGIGIALATPTKYEATAEILTDPRGLTLAESDPAGQGVPADATLAIVENQIAVLMSGTVLTQVVDKLNLTADAEFNGEKSGFSVGAFLGELRALLTRSGGGDAARDNTLAVENLTRSLNVERGSRALAIEIGVSTESADKSALIANTVADTFLQSYGQIQSQTAGRAADDRSARLDELRKGVEAAERKVTAFKAENDIVDPQGRPITDDEIVRLNEQLSTARARTLELNARAASVRDIDVDSVLGGGIPESLASDVITELMAQYAAARQEADRLTVRLGPRHPERQAADAQVSGMREQIGGELRRIASFVQVDLKRAVELEQQLAQRLAQMKVRHGDVGDELVQLRELEREVATKRAAYDSYRQQAAGITEQRGTNAADMTVISRAYPPLDPAGPSRSLIALAGLLLGFASGVGLAAMRGVSDTLAGRGDARPMHAIDGEDAATPTASVVPTSNGHPEYGSRESQPLASSVVQPSAAPSPQPVTQQIVSTPRVTTEDKPMHHRYADPHQAWNAAQPGNQPNQRGWAPPHQQMPAGYTPYPAGQPMPGAYAQPMPPAYHPAPQPAYPHPFQGYDHNGYPQPPMPQPYPPYGMAQPGPVYPPYPPAYPMPDMHHAPVAGYRPPDAPNVIAYPERYVRAVDAAPPVSASLAEERAASSRAIEEIRASLAEFREAVRDLTESRQKRRFF